MPAPTPLVELLEVAYQSFLDGRPSGLLALLDDTVVYHLPGLHLGGGTLRGRDALLERLTAAARACASPPRVDLLSTVSGGELVVTLERFQAVSLTATLDQHACVVWRFAGTRCAEIWAHFENQRACDAFWQGVSV